MAFRKRDPMKTRNDRVNLKPLSVAQLTAMIEKSPKPRLKGKIQRRINNLQARSK